jgi:hypothetical protein
LKISQSKFWEQIKKGELNMKRFWVLLIVVCFVTPLFADAEKKAPPTSGSPVASVIVKTPADAAYLKGRNLRGSPETISVTTDTYVTTDTFARHVSLKYGCNIKVDPIVKGIKAGRNDSDRHC